MLIVFMVLEKLGESLKNTLAKITKAMFVDEKLVNELVKEIQKALLQSDVNVKLVFELSQRIKDRALKEETPGTISKKEWLIKIVYEELARFLGEEEYHLELGKKKPVTIMLVGLFGNGKTTTAGKLAKYFQKRGYKVALMSTDTWRPAAFMQLEQLGKQINTPVFGDPKQKDPTKIYKQFEKELSKYDVAIIDTAGRDALSDELIEELNKLNKAVQPDQTLLVMAADVGQAAQKQAEVFHQTCRVTGVIITKLEGTAKGGGALAACSVTGAKVAFIGIGEKIDDLEKFRPKNFVGRLLGMGDLQSLIEKIRSVTDEDKQEKIKKQLEDGKLSLEDVIEQVKSMNSLGGFEKIKSMIPGLGKAKIPENVLESQQEKVAKWEHIIKSMTPEEKENPGLLKKQTSRISRVAKGAGVSASEIRSLIKQYDMLNEMIKSQGSMNMESGMPNQKQMMKLAKKFGKFKKMRL